eukprot:scaffold2848_cov352-Pavlova_lutheri.AAC.36
MHTPILQSWGASTPASSAASRMVSPSSTCTSWTVPSKASISTFLARTTRDPRDLEGRGDLEDHVGDLNRDEQAAFARIFFLFVDTRRRGVSRRPPPSGRIGSLDPFHRYLSRIVSMSDRDRSGIHQVSFPIRTGPSAVSDQIRVSIARFSSAIHPSLSTLAEEIPPPLGHPHPHPSGFVPI